MTTSTMSTRFAQEDSWMTVFISKQWWKNRFGWLLQDLELLRELCCRYFLKTRKFGQGPILTELRCRVDRKSTVFTFHKAYETKNKIWVQHSLTLIVTVHSWRLKICFGTQSTLLSRASRFQTREVYQRRRLHRWRGCYGKKQLLGFLNGASQMSWHQNGLSRALLDYCKTHLSFWYNTREIGGVAGEL